MVPFSRSQCVGILDFLDFSCKLLDFDPYNFLREHRVKSKVGAIDRPHQRASLDVYYVPIMYSLRGLMMVS